jgi:hypothetical protein
LLKKQSSGFAGKLKQRSENAYNNSENAPSRDNGENSFSSSVTSVEPLTKNLEPGESATVEQLQRIRELVGQGMREDIAREQVLGKGWVAP